MQGLSAGVLLAGLTISTVAAPKLPDLKQQALRILRLSHPDVRWQLERPLTAEFTGDGEDDLAVQGTRGADFAVGVIVGPIGPLSRMLNMVWPAAGDLKSSDCENNAAPLLVAEAVTLPADLWGVPESSPKPSSVQA